MVDVTSSFQRLIQTVMHQSMHRFIFYVKGRGLSMSQIGTLFFLRHREFCAVSDIGEHLGITAPASSQLLNRLVDEGLIERQESPQDRRVKQIVLTPSGLQLIDESIQARQAWLDRLVDTLSEEEQALVDTALNLLIEKTAQFNELEKLEKVE